MHRSLAACMAVQEETRACRAPRAVFGWGRYLCVATIQMCQSGVHSGTSCNHPTPCQLAVRSCHHSCKGRHPLLCPAGHVRAAAAGTAGQRLVAWWAVPAAGAGGASAGGGVPTGVHHCAPRHGRGLHQGAPFACDTCMAAHSCMLVQLWGMLCAWVMGYCRNSSSVGGLIPRMLQPMHHGGLSSTGAAHLLWTSVCTCAPSSLPACCRR